MRLFIKNMVSIRCKMKVISALNELKFGYLSIGFGEVTTDVELDLNQKEKLRIKLLESGLILMDDKKAILIAKIKQVIFKMTHADRDITKIRNSTYISNELKLDYHFLSTLFNTETGTTIEHYIILQKVEQIKLLLTDDALSLAEISYEMKYSSVAHLSAQFKKITNLTPKLFKSQIGFIPVLPMAV
ncbi:MAG: AraC family transcriptional regulator [Saprospiraceae bacterium]